MLQVQFVPNSLLYGESYNWIILNFVAPLHLTPNFRTTRSRHVASRLPHSGRIMDFITRANEGSLIKRACGYAFMFFQLVYLVAYVFLGVTQQDLVLTSLGIKKTETLTYKILSQTPSAFRAGLFVITLTNLRESNYRMWTIFDKFSEISTSIRNQVRVTYLCLGVMVPDALLNACEALFIINFAHSSEHYQTSWAGQLERERLWIRLAVWNAYVILFGLSLSNTMIRYKPVMNLTYAALCVGRHLDLVRSQLVSRAKESHWHEPEEASGDSLQAGCGPRPPASSKLPVGPGQHAGRNPLQLSEGLGRSLIKPSRRLTTTTTTEGEPKENREQIEDRQDEELLVISNLQQFERHLTRIQLFVGDIDRESPEAILTLTIINSMTFFYTIFYVAQSPVVSLLNIIGGTVYCVARSASLVLMFVAGNQLEKSCKRMNNKLELIYLQEQSQSLIYKQMAGSRLSLAHIFLALEKIRFNCNNLMDVNARTLRKCALYICTVVLIVVQYDSLTAAPTSGARPALERQS